MTDVIHDTDPRIWRRKQSLVIFCVQVLAILMCIVGAVWMMWVAYDERNLNFGVPFLALLLVMLWHRKAQRFIGRQAERIVGFRPKKYVVKAVPALVIAGVFVFYIFLSVSTVATPPGYLRLMGDGTILSSSGGARRNNPFVRQSVTIPLKLSFETSVELFDDVSAGGRYHREVVINGTLTFNETEAFQRQISELGPKRLGFGEYRGVQERRQKDTFARVFFHAVYLKNAVAIVLMDVGDKRLSAEPATLRYALSQEIKKRRLPLWLVRFDFDKATLGIISQHR